MENHQNTSAFILAGGKSKRFKKDKVFFPYKGKPLIEHVIDKVKPVIGNIVIIANDIERFNYLQIPCYPDKVKDMGAIGGLYTALSLCKTENAFVLGCDMPDINSDLISYMISIREKDDDIVTPLVNNRYEPLYALYSLHCIPFIEECIRSGERQIISFFPKVRTRTVCETEIRQFADPQIIFHNINYPDDIYKTL